jgi:hypothetical protein
MKVSVDVDATPEELRRFFGLPDLSPLNDEMVATLRERMQEGAEGYDPFSLMASGAPGMDTLQKLFWNAWSSGQSSGPSQSDEGSDDKK